MMKTKTLWYVWVCPNCFAELKVNYNATEEDFLRFKDCLCGHELKWKENRYETEDK